MAGIFNPKLKNKGVKAQPSKPLFTDSTDKYLDIKELVLEGRREIGDDEEIKDVSFSLTDIPPSEVKAFLKERIDSLTVEGTIHAMSEAIKSMETQLISVLEINASQKNDLKVMKENVIKVAKENEALKSKIKEMEEAGLSKAELELELRQLITELNNNQEKLQDLTGEKEKLELKRNDRDREIAILEEEKNDAMKYASSIETKIVNLVAMKRNYEDQINKLKRENLYNIELVKNQENDLSVLKKEKSVLEFELKETKGIFDEIYTELAGIKSKTKKFL